MSSATTTGLEPSPTSEPHQHNQLPPLGVISEAEDNENDDETEEEAEETESVSNPHADIDEREQIGGGMLKETVVRSGYLFKKGERRKAWKRRFFVLRPDRLCYYKDDKEYQILRKIAVSDIHTCARVEVKKHANTFGIVTPKRTYYVRSEDSKTADAWVEAINEARYSASLASTSISEEHTPVATTAPTPREAPIAASQPIYIPTSPSLSSSPAIASSSSSQSQIQGDYVVTTYPKQPDIGVHQTYSSSGASHNSPDGVHPTNANGNFLSASFEQASSVSSRDTSLQEPAQRPKEIVTSSSEEDDDNEDDVSGSRQVGISQPESPPASFGNRDRQRLVMAGYLMKQGKRKNWRKRWFMLDNQKLVYTRSHIDAKVHRSIPLDSILDVIEYSPAIKERPKFQGVAGPLSPLLSPSDGSPGPASKSISNSFKIITPSRTFLVCAPTEEDEIRWLSALRVLVSAKRKPEVDRPSTVSQVPDNK